MSGILSSALLPFVYLRNIVSINQIHHHHIFFRLGSSKFGRVNCNDLLLFCQWSIQIIIYITHKIIAQLNENFKVSGSGRSGPSGRWVTYLNVPFIDNLSPFFNGLYNLFPLFFFFLKSDYLRCRFFEHECRKFFDIQLFNNSLEGFSKIYPDSPKFSGPIRSSISLERLEFYLKT